MAEDRLLAALIAQAAERAAARDRFEAGMLAVAMWNEQIAALDVCRRMAPKVLRALRACADFGLADGG